MTTPEPKVSVIVLVHNRAGKVLDTLRSVQAQTMPDWEALVVDDASTDGSADAVESLGDPRIRLIRHDANRGPAAARNTALRSARSECLALLDSDDLREPHKLEVQLSLMRKSSLSPGVVYSGYTRVQFDRPLRTLFVPRWRGDVYEDLLWGPVCPPLVLMIRKPLMVEAGMMDERINPAYEEWDLMVRLARRARFDFVEEPLATYVCHEGPTLSKSLLDAALGYRDVFDKHRSEIERLLGPRGLAYHCDKLARHYAAAGKTACAARYAWRALLHEPRLARALVNGLFVARSLRPRPDFRGDEF